MAYRPQREEKQRLWADVENILKIRIIPELQAVLGVCGFDNVRSIRTITSADISQIDLCCKSQGRYMPPGHIKLLVEIIDAIDNRLAQYRLKKLEMKYFKKMEER